MADRRPDWQGIWERLRKLGIEFTKDRRNGIVQAYERIVDPLSIGWRPLIKRYIEGDDGIHVHMRQRVQQSPYLLGSPNLCATFDWPRGFLLKDSELQSFALTLDVMEPDEEKREMKVAVLVDVPEFIENRERLFGRILPCYKRLQPLDVCAETWPDSPEALRFLGGSPGEEIPGVVHGVGLGVDREADIPPLAPRSSLGDGVGRGHVTSVNGELPNEMVKCRAEIVDHVSDDCAPLMHGRLPDRLGVDDYLSGLMVRVVGNSIQATIVHERLDLFLEEVQVHIRPLDLGPASI